MRAFIIRPFGRKKDGKGNEIDFDKVAEELIGPALAAVGATGRETLDIVQSGNIRVDMFRRLLTADLVVADLSIHNANVFYELGIRHALRDHGTLMLRCDADAFPFDLQTDRYFTYDKNDPQASLPLLVQSLQSIKDEIAQNYTAKDSPVFASLPNLTEPDPSLFNPVPQDFGEDVSRAAAGGQAGDLALFSYEVKGLEWELRGWRAVGKAQFELGAFPGARTTWEYIRQLDPQNLEANVLLGTIYQRLGDLVSSTQALERALENPAIDSTQRAETYALMASNLKKRWGDDWTTKAPDERGAAALRSPHLQAAFANYRSAFDECLNHFHSGLNALAMLKIIIALAELLPEVWSEQFSSDRKAENALDDYHEEARQLACGVQLSLEANARQLERDQRQDVWLEISRADLAFLTTTTAPQRVAAAYRRAVAAERDFNVSSIRNQLAIYRDLGVLTENLAEVFKVVKEPPPLEVSKSVSGAVTPRKQVLVFTGHRIDAPDRKSPRFPADKESIAREKIKEAIVEQMNKGGGVASAYAGAASGGDILFLEVCEELGIPTHFYLAMPAPVYVTKSVSDGGSEWVDRFWKLHDQHAARNEIRVLSSAVEVNDDSEYLPAWLRGKPDYNIWQRNNLWTLFNALAESADPKTGDPNLTLIALWDGQEGDGPGGAADLVEKVKNVGARFKIINTKEVFGL
jgi:tetratricopeptide (TPR) repeat protein